MYYDEEVKENSMNEKRREMISLRISTNLKYEILKLARYEKVSINTMINLLLQDKIQYLNNMEVINGKKNIAIIIFVVMVLSTLHHIFKKPGSEWWWHTKDRHPFQTFLLLTEMCSSLVLAGVSLKILFEKNINTDEN